MATIESADALGRLASDGEACIGAAFVTYTFDAPFFEENVLATVVQLHEDPEAATRRFLDEARRRLVETPVMVIADPGMLRGGQRLPYDLLRADARRTFHPKLALLLYPGGARLAIGSGNLTPGGYGDNAELSAVLTLDYRNDAPLLRQVVAFLERCGARGEAWTRFAAELTPRLGPNRRTRRDPPWLLHTFAGEPLLDQFLERLPQDAVVDRIGILAPFHQEDGAPPDAAVLDRLIDAAEGRRGPKFGLDVGLSWDANAIGPTGSQPVVDPAAHTGMLWGFIGGDRGREDVTWCILREHVDRHFTTDNGRTPGWRSTRELNGLQTTGAAWPVGPVVAFGPADLLDRAAKRATVRLWVHPEVRRRSGRVFRQPLHGKLIAVAITEAGVKRTHLLIGSPNASAAALLQPKGNVECALHLVVEGHKDLGQLSEALVLVPRQQLRLQDRQFTAQAPSPARWVEDAVFDARERQLQVTWRAGAPRLQLDYPASHRRPLVDAKPSGTMTFTNFELESNCCELEVTDPASGVSGRVPLRCVHVIDLPVAGLTTEPNLEELLLLHAGRMTPAGVAAKRADRAGTMDGGSDTTGVFGATLTPREVFRALLGIGDELARAPSLGVFQTLLLGPWGVRKLAERIARAPDHGELRRAESWIYGQELAKVLAAVSFEGDPTAPAKKALRDELVDWLRQHLPEPDPSTLGLAQVRTFYGVTHEA